MILKIGNIYSFHYRRYKVDPNPLVLVLYCDKDICHALNFHYLSKELNEQLIHMIATLAVKNNKDIDTYNLYHNWMKRHIPAVIRNAYRTYKPNQITSVKKVTNGYWGIKTFLKEKEEKEKHLKTTQVQERISKKINKKKAETLANKKLNLNKLQDYIINYVNYVDKLIKENRKEDKSIYTKLKK